MQNSESETRALISYEWNPYNWFLQKFGTNLEDPGAFEKFLQSLQENPPDVMAGSGFLGAVPFDWGYRGAIAGRLDSVPFSQAADGLLTFAIPHLRIYSVAVIK